ncbi:phospholipase D-like domain-containing protein [Nocardioides sp.]|uniref:phospholipase D-like domain-containing protein n=1 Tax=Nocardioides sp. TaxID=35761 RepID=UPI00273332D5|nr:phospholipase D-like domain-containing protein [Nocardioides sp.]MDP3890598.1 phospholipase D-like domain-containing protein [Nocardioides sp.]
MRRTNLATVLVTVLTVLLAGLTLAPSASAKYQPQPGVITNNPLGPPAAKHRINDHLIRSIKSTPKRGKIRVHSWNIRSVRFVDALIAAHKRGVSVRAIIWIGNAERPGEPSIHGQTNLNPAFDRLTAALKKSGNKKRSKARKSGTTRCKASCRGRGGIAHSKYYLFSKVGKVKHVVVYGGANATDLAATHQWNDVDTITGRQAIYDDFLKIFDQSYKDKPVKRAWVSTKRGKIEPQFYPHQGPGVFGDPVIKDIKRITCTGATNGVNGRTKIRIAMTSWHGDRGINIAKHLVAKQNQGCNVKIVYAVAGNEVLRVLRREGKKPIPLRQITQDFDGDGVYDRYLHTKVMVVQGHWGGNRSASMVWNGSANWSPLVMRSDEAGVRMNNAPRARRYAKYVDWLYANPPVQARPNPTLMARTYSQGIDPYSKIEVD